LVAATVGAAWFRPHRGAVDAVVGHEAHERVDVTVVPGHPECAEPLGCHHGTGGLLTGLIRRLGRCVGVPTGGPRWLLGHVCCVPSESAGMAAVPGYRSGSTRSGSADNSSRSCSLG